MLNIEQLEAKFDFKKPQIRNICKTILARKKNVDYYWEYFSNYKQKQALQEALLGTKDFMGSGFNYNIFNRFILRCVFFSLISNNVSRIDNLEEMMLVLFPEVFTKYTSDPKSFSFVKLYQEFPNANITATLKVIFDNYYSSFIKLQKLRDRIEHSKLDGILNSDYMLDEEDDCFVNADFTFSGNEEDLASFAKSLNELLLKIEEQIFNCLLKYGKDCLCDVANL